MLKRSLLTLLLLSAICIPSYSLSQLADTPTHSKFITSSTNRMQTKIDSLGNEVNALSQELSKYEISRSFFKNDITIATVLFSAITAITIAVMGYIVGYLMPRRNEKRYQKRIEDINTNFNKIKENVDIKINSLEQKHLKHDLNFASAMYFIHNNNGMVSSDATILWAIRYLEIYYNLYQNHERNISNIKERISAAKFQIDKILKFNTPQKENSVKKIKERIDPINQILKDIKMKEHDEEIKSWITALQEKLYQLVYTETEGEEEDDDLPF